MKYQHECNAIYYKEVHLGMNYFPLFSVFVAKAMRLMESFILEISC